MKQYLWKEAQQLINQGNVYLCFSSTWCIDCKIMQPIVEKLEAICQKDKLDIKFISVDADESNLFRDKNHPMKVLYIPAHIYIKNGKVVNTFYEIQTIDFLLEKVHELIALK